MATIKSYSDLQQSKKLAEILPLESADMYYEYLNAFGEFVDTPQVIVGGHISEYFIRFPKDFVAWSLAALLDVLDFPSLTQNKEDEWEVCVFDHDNDDYIEKTADNPVDACVAMIIRLNELNLL